MEMMEAAEFNAVVDEIFTRKLANRGLEPVKGHKWVNSDNSEIRKLFTVHSARGVQLWPMWGFSFDFAPHIGPGNKIQWHRTTKAAIYDLPYDPIDYTRNVGEWSISRFGKKDQIIKNAEQVANRAVTEAETFWGRVSKLEDVVSVFEEWRTRRYVRFGFHNYVNAPLSYSFALAKLGRKSDATEWLKVFAPSVTPETAERLFALLEKVLQQHS